MKHAKRFASILLAVVMLFALSVTAFADGETAFTITAPDNGHTYEIYQIFTGDLYQGVLSNIKWGQNGTGTVNTPVPNTVLAELEAATGTDSAKLDVISRYVDLESAPYNTVASGASLTDVPAGYYLIKDVDRALAGENDSYTTYLVKVVGNVDITPKAAVPSREKKVKDINDSTGAASSWQDSADYDIGDAVPFQLKGTVASNYDAYKVYQFIFHDQEAAGLTFNAGSVKVYVDGTPITEGYTVQSPAADGDTFDVIFTDLKQIASVHAGSVITVEYTSTLNTGAIHGAQGNRNEMYLEYSNNPNDAQGSETGKTPKDIVIVFTYKTIIDKITKNPDYDAAVEGSEEYIALNGAAFKLEKLIKGDGAEDTWVQVKAFTVDAQNPVSSFTFTGLDDGTYKLTETTTPNGYNTIDPIEFTVAATHDELADVPTLTALTGEAATGDLTFTSNLSEGSLTAKVINNAGSTLPETGGTGTTIFYILGSVLLLGAAVLLITRRRMHTKD